MMQPRFILLTLLALAVGIVLGWLATNARRQTMAYAVNVMEIDANRDGKTDSEIIYENGLVSKVRSDRNVDGSWDYFEWYEDGALAKAETDDNFDGKVDGWVDYENAIIVRAKYDTDHNSVPDVFLAFRHGVLHIVLWRPNESKAVLQAEIFAAGVKERAYFDSNGDGLLDRVTYFDRFEIPIRDEKIDDELRLEDLFQSEAGR